MRSVEEYMSLYHHTFYIRNLFGRASAGSYNLYGDTCGDVISLDMWRGALL